MNYESTNISEGDNKKKIRLSFCVGSYRQTVYIGIYELPGGRVAYGEQPEDTLRRVLHDDAGLHMDRSELVDVISYIDKDDRDIQYAVITYNVLLSEGTTA